MKTMTRTNLTAKDKQEVRKVEGWPHLPHRLLVTSGDVGTAERIFF